MSFGWRFSSATRLKNVSVCHRFRRRPSKASEEIMIASAGVSAIAQIDRFSSGSRCSPTSTPPGPRRANDARRVSFRSQARNRQASTTPPGSPAETTGPKSYPTCVVQHGCSRRALSCFNFGKRGDLTVADGLKQCKGNHSAFVANGRHAWRSVWMISTMIDYMANFVYAENRNEPLVTAH